MTISLAEKIRIATALCADARLSHAQFRVAAALLFDFHNTKTGECFPSYPQLAAASRTSETTAKRTTEKLKAMGVVDFERTSGGRNKRNRYSLKTVSPADGLDDETVSPADGFESEKGPLVHEKGPLGTDKGSAIADPHKTHEVNTGINTGERAREPTRAHSYAIAKGSRLPEDWRTDEQDLAYARSLGMAEPMILREAEKFRNHWLSTSGVKSDWRATWRNWCIRAHETRTTRRTAVAGAARGQAPCRSRRAVGHQSGGERRIGIATGDFRRHHAPAHRDDAVRYRRPRR